MNKLGFNLHNITPNTLDIFSRLRPRVVLVFGSSWGQNLNLIPQLYEILGNDTVYVYRSWSWKSPGDLDHFEYFKESDASAFVDDTSRLNDQLPEHLRNNTYWYTLNETGHSNDDIKRYFDWHESAVAYANRRGLRLLTLNFGTGNPTGSPLEITTKWTLAEGLLREMAKTGLSAVGLHEYFPGKWDVDLTWLVARYKRLQETCSMLSIQQPAIIFSEYGTDAALGPAGNHATLPSGIRSGGWKAMVDAGVLTQKTLADQIILSHRAVYDNDPHVIGTCYFSWGAVTDQWADYNIADAHETLELLIKSKGTTTMTVCEQALAAPRQAQSPTLRYRLLNNLRVRSAPVFDICSDTGALLNTGTVVEVLSEVTFGGYTWVEIPDFSFIAKSSDDGDVYLELVAPEEPTHVARTQGDVSGQLLELLAALVTDITYTVE